MPHYLVTIQMNYRQMFLIEAASADEARLTYGDGEYSDDSHGEPEIIAVEQVPLEHAKGQLDLFGKCT